MDNIINQNGHSSMINNKLRVVFFGTPKFVDPIIEKLDKSFDLVAVIRKPADFDKDFCKDLEHLDADFFVVAAYGKIIPENVLSIPKKACINIHPSLLPKYRGPSPIQSAILDGSTKTGATFIKMDSEVDHGPIIFQFEDEISPTDTFQSLAEKLFSRSAQELEHVITSYNEENLQIQDEKNATFTKLFNKEDGFVDLSSPPENLNLKIRALFPWPGVWTKFALSEKEVIIKLLPDQKIQVEGKNPMNYKDLKNGYPRGAEFINKLGLDEA